MSNKDKIIDELKSHGKENTAKIFFGWILTKRLIQSSGIKPAQRLNKKTLITHTNLGVLKWIRIKEGDVGN